MDMGNAIISPYFETNQNYRLNYIKPNSFSCAGSFIKLCWYFYASTVSRLIKTKYGPIMRM